MAEVQEEGESRKRKHKKASKRKISLGENRLVDEEMASPAREIGLKLRTGSSTGLSERRLTGVH